MDERCLIPKRNPSVSLLPRPSSCSECSWDEMHVTTVSHGHPDGKQVKRFTQYSKNSMETVDLLWAEDGEIVVQED